MSRSKWSPLSFFSSILDYEYELKQGDNYKDCKEIHTRRTEELNKVCVFDVEQLGGDCVKQQNYGFDDGQPCVLLKLNRVCYVYPWAGWAVLY